MKKVIPLLLVLVLSGYFGYRSWEKDRAEKLDDRFYGTAEAEEVILSAQVIGEVREFNAQEGQAVKAGDLLARIDDTSLQAQLKQANAAAHAAGSQAEVVAANLSGVNTELARIAKLLASGSATTMQRDTLGTQKAALLAQKQAILSQVKQAKAAAGVVETQIAHTRVTAPVAGTILRTHVQLGETVEIFTDAEPGKPLAGTVSHIADSAEFTPKNVQTKDERVRLIYKIKILVPNPDGVLKIGMPVDVRFTAR